MSNTKTSSKETLAGSKATYFALHVASGIVDSQILLTMSSAHLPLPIHISSFKTFITGTYI